MDDASRLPPIRVAVLHDGRVAQEALAHVIDAQPDLCVVTDEAVNGGHGLPVPLPGPVDVALVVANGPGADLCERVRAAGAALVGARVVALGGYVDDQLAAAALAAGASDVLSSSCSLVDLLAALHGRRRLAPGADGHLSLDLDERARVVAASCGLTARQHEVLRLLATGATPDAVSRRLGIALDTCRDHIKAGRRTLGCSSVTELLVVAFRLGLLPELAAPLPVAVDRAAVRSSVG